MITHHKVAVLSDFGGGKVGQIFVLRRHVWLGERHTVHVYDSFADFHHFARQRDDALDERLRTVQRIPEDDNISALDGLETVDKFVNEDALLIGEQRRHAGAFDLHGLIEEDDDDESEADRDEQIASPDANLVSQGMVGVI